MKTMMELLIRLEQLRHCCQRATHNRQLTEQERNTPLGLKGLVRDSLPPEVLTHYDRMKKTESDLVLCPEVFAMAVLVSTYRDLLPRQRRKLVTHFATPAPAPAHAGTPRRLKAATGGAIGEPWPRCSAAHDQPVHHHAERGPGSHFKTPAGPPAARATVIEW